MSKRKDTDGDVIFRPYFTTKQGKKIWAWKYGLRAWAIPVKPKTTDK